MANEPPWWTRVVSDPRCCAAEASTWQPSVDVYRTLAGWLVKFDLAGVRPTDIEISRQGCLLRVAGQRRDLTARRALASYSLEISYNRFERAVRLPADIERSAMRTEFEQGMLLIWLESLAGPAPRP